MLEDTENLGRLKKWPDRHQGLFFVFRKVGQNKGIVCPGKL